MQKQVTNLQTGVTKMVSLTPEEIAEREAYERDILPDILRKDAERERAAAYAAEADPLFFKAQRGEATNDEWLAKIEEIKARYPYPS